MNNDAGPTRKEHPLAAEPGARQQLPGPVDEASLELSHVRSR